MIASGSTLSTGLHLLKVHVFPCFQSCSNIISIVLGLPDMINKANTVATENSFACRAGSHTSDAIGQKRFFSLAFWLTRIGWFF